MYFEQNNFNCRRRYIAIRNLDEELEVVQKFPRQSKYDVGAAEWNPTGYKRELCVISVSVQLNGS